MSFIRFLISGFSLKIDNLKALQVLKCKFRNMLKYTGKMQFNRLISYNWKERIDRRDLIMILMAHKMHVT